MEIFSNVVGFVAQSVPEWAAFLACPALLVLFTLVLALFGGKKAFWALAVFSCGAGFFLVACIAGTDTALCYLALCVVLSSLLRLVLFLPRVGKKSRAKEGAAREEQIYEKFREPLTVPFEEKSEPRAYENSGAAATAEECGMQLDYVTGLLTKLKAERLTASDRLEAEVLTRAIDSYRGKALGEQELGSLNDCLASVLKMTAKYKL